MVHKIDTSIFTRLLFRDKETHALQTGKTVTYKIYKEDNTLFDSGNMSELLTTAIYYKAWTPNAAGWWIVYISCSNPVMNDMFAYFVESGVEKDIKNLLEDATYGLSAIETLTDELESLLKNGTYGLAQLARSAALSAHDSDIKALLATVQTDLDNPNQFKADVSALALQATVTQYANYKADVSALALEATLTTMKGAGWSNETLKAIYDLVAGLNDLAQSDILNDTTPFAGGDITLIKTETDKIAAIKTETDKIPTLLTESQSHPTLAEIEGSAVLALKAHLVNGSGDITPPANKGIWDYLPDIATIKTYLESGGAIYDFIDEVESLLKNASYGLSALKTEIDANEAKIDALNDISIAQVNAEVDTALADIHLDHLIAITGSVSDVGPAAGDFDTDLASATNDWYNGMILLFISGSLAGLARRIDDYVGASKNIILENAFPAAPANGDDFVIVGIEALSGGAGAAGGYNDITVYPWAGTAVLDDDPDYTYTSEVSENAGNYTKVAHFDFDEASATIKSIFVNLIWAQKMTDAGTCKVKWQIAAGTDASPTGAYVDITDEVEETETTYQEKGRSGVVHKITNLTTTTPFTIRCMVKKVGGTSAEAKIKSNSYIRVSYKV